VAATVHSLNHIKSLAIFKKVERRNVVKEVMTGVRENRLSALVIHVMIAASVFFLDYIGFIPMPVLFGLFLYMGLASLGGNQFFERVMLFFTDPKHYPKNYYTKHVPRKWIHKFTIIQLFCLVALWVLKASPLGILFPLLIAALVPIQWLLNKIFPPEYMEALVAEEHDDEEEKHTLD
jgi:hypothetical protein